MKLITKIFVNVYKYIAPIKCARLLGVKIGDKCKTFGSVNWGSEPFLITLGNHTEVSFGVTFITHDGATWCFRDEEEYRGAMKYGRIHVGNDCFIGAKSIILPGVSIGDKSIVAAGAVVAKSIPSGEVWGGVPARFISKTSDYADKILDSSPKNVEGLKSLSRRERIIRLADEIEKIRMQ